MHKNKDVELLIQEINSMPVLLNQKIENEEEINIDKFIFKIQDLLIMVSEMSEEELLLYKDRAQECCNHIAAIINHIREKQKSIRNELSSLNKRLEAQKAYKNN